MVNFFGNLMSLALFSIAITLGALEVESLPAIPGITAEEIASYQLPEDHPLASLLDELFADPKTLRNESELKRAGFKILHQRPSSMLVASHPRLKGHLIKIHLHNGSRTFEQIWDNWVNRCKGADNVRKLIDEKKIRHFTVAHKWIYFPKIEEPLPILIVTHMRTRSKEESIAAWKTQITRRHLREIFCLVSHGFASTSFPSNIPYLGKGRFAFVDTERPFREPIYEHGRAHLSPTMQAYWDTLLKNHLAR